MTTWPLLIEPISRLLDKIIPDPDARARAQMELIKAEREFDLQEIGLALQADQSQANVNQVEAAHRSLFVAGWRPFIGWVCGAAFAYHFILQPFLIFLYTLHGTKIDLPVFDMDALSTVLIGMLGLGGMRTVEKMRRITK